MPMNASQPAAHTREQALTARFYKVAVINAMAAATATVKGKYRSAGQAYSTE
jgi:hypothetical protein